jgi:signal transduction histidine kinase
LSNAVKYNRPNGFVNIRTWKDTGKVWISVQDSGVGIPEDSLKHIFQRFYRVQTTEHVASGTGLGLSITKRIIDSHGGEITVKSKLGEGTTYTLYLPAQHKS